MTTDHAFANLAAYDIWAATYPPAPHNPLMRAEQRIMQELWPAAGQLAEARALDLACGSGRYARLLQESGAALTVALDFSASMLRRMRGDARVHGDMMSLPFASRAFALVVCGLAVGHAARLDGWMAEIARVLAPGGVLLYSDFHPEAAAAGMTRSFTDVANRCHTLLHRRHEKADHARAAQVAGLEIEALREARVGLELREELAGAADLYRRWHGLPVVLAIRARKPSHA